jgi:hypothetical protein
MKLSRRRPDGRGGGEGVNRKIKKRQERCRSEIPENYLLQLYYVER